MRSTLQVNKVTKRREREWHGERNEGRESEDCKVCGGRRMFEALRRLLDWCLVLRTSRPFGVNEPPSAAGFLVFSAGCNVPGDGTK